MTSLALSNIDDKTKGRIISGAIHLLLLLLALWPLLIDKEWVDQNDMVIEFAETVIPAEDVEQGGARLPDTRKISSVPNNISRDEIDTDRVEATSSEQATAVEEKAEVIERSRKEVLASAEDPKSTHGSRNFGSLFNREGNREIASGSEGSAEGKQALSGLGRLSGEVGRGLQGRQIVYAPEIFDDSQKTGRVVVDICVNADGDVVSAVYTQKGSDTADSYLVKKAEEAAWKWKFNPSTVARQCGVITIDFLIK